MLRSLVLEELGSQWFINEQTPAPRPASAVGSGSLMTAAAKFAYDNYGSSSIVKTVVHTVIAASAEYGLALATGATSMAGPSEALETWVDTLFLVETSILTAASLLNATGIQGAGKRLIESCQGAWSSLPQGLLSFYNAIKAIVSTIVKNAELISYGLQQLANSIKKYLETVAEDIKNYIKVLIPDATIGAAAATAIGAVLTSATPYAFTALVTAFKVAAPWAAWILDPKNALNLFDRGFLLLLQSIEQAAQKLESGQLSKSIPQSPATSVNLGNLTDPRRAAARNATLSSLPDRNSAPQPPATLNSPAAVKSFVTNTIPQTTASLSKLAPSTLRDAGATLKQKQPAARQKLETIVRQLMPFYFGLLALFQIITNSDYDQTIMQQAVIARNLGSGLNAAAARGGSITVGQEAGKEIGPELAADWAETNENKEMLLRKVISEELHKQSRRSLKQRRS